jgi:hypothetical protein
VVRDTGSLAYAVVDSEVSAPTRVPASLRSSVTNAAGSSSACAYAMAAQTNITATFTSRA